MTAAPRIDPEALSFASPTEMRNPRTVDIDRLETLDMLRLINSEDATIAGAVAEVLPQLAKAVDYAVASLRSGHRVHYVGAGTSGRLGVLDAAELLPTFTLEPGRVVAHIAGGPAAMLRAVEEVEDDAAAGRADVAGVEPGDLVIGLTASGRTPYVIGALAAAAEVGAGTVLISANPLADYRDSVDVNVALDTGPEVIAGSTRMKAGTAQKLALNAFSTAVMVRLGRTYSNLMVHVAATNDKLRGRLIRLLVQATGLAEDVCTEALETTDGEVKTALVVLLTGSEVGAAREALGTAHGVVRDAIAELTR
ncbi:N-acetylmuramic acid 6-phosphate etherase [Fodinicola acaciae]|uniref:N-acetylmuramic acid 6-phosphate etherase n=1 Tax=Fodinicola acaciae TaxID=2681555 RepID=UPI0013D30CA8|nr:N-acetylmuramic acid 6-phosphate etherase [Fodinicola acaciae]